MSEPGLFTEQTSSLTAASEYLPPIRTLQRQSLGEAAVVCVLDGMDRSALLETLAMSEKNKSLVEIRVTGGTRPLVGAVEKVLNQIIILKPSSARPVTLTLGDIESVRSCRTRYGCWKSAITRTLRNVSLLARQG